jgi:hypothetical protein
VAFPEVTTVLIPSPVKQPVMTETQREPDYNQIHVHRRDEDPVLVIDRRARTTPDSRLLDYSGRGGRFWAPAPEVIPPADPFIEAVQATLQPAPAGTRRVYFGGGL